MYEHQETSFSIDLTIQERLAFKTLGEGNELAKAQLKHEQAVK